MKNLIIKSNLLLGNNAYQALRCRSRASSNFNFKGMVDAIVVALLGF